MISPKLSIISLYSFYFVAISNLLAQVIDIGWLNMISKPLLMITLAAYYYFTSEKRSSLPGKLIFMALLFSWLGDCLLMLQQIIEGAFVYGLSAFLLAHVFYMFVFKNSQFETQSKDYKSFITTRIGFLLFIGSALIYMLFPFLNELAIPVILYTLVITAMAIFALLRRGKTVEKSFIMVYSGALLFIMSDAMIAIDKFMSPIVQARLLIMATYISAQFLIVKGILAHEQNDLATSSTKVQ